MGTKRNAGQTCIHTGNNSKTKIRKTAYKKSFAVKQLEQLANDEARRKFPEIPAEWLAPRKYRDDSANGLTKCIIDFLKLQNCWAERIANMGRQINSSREAQKQYQQNIEQAGGIYIIASSFEQFHNWYNTFIHAS